MIKRAGIPDTLGPTGISMVDVHDVAEAAAVALTSEGHHGKTYNVNGPDALSGPAVAAIWSEVQGKEVRLPGPRYGGFQGENARADVSQRPAEREHRSAQQKTQPPTRRG